MGERPWAEFFLKGPCLFMEPGFPSRLFLLRILVDASMFKRGPMTCHFHTEAMLPSSPRLSLHTSPDLFLLGFVHLLF